MKYALSESARIAMEDAYFYGATNWGDDQAAAYHLGLVSAFELLSRYPLVGKPVDEYSAGLRQHRYGKHFIFYLVIDDLVRIVELRHTSGDARAHFLDT